MRINQFVARATGMSRRAADQAVAEKRVTIDGRVAEPGSQATGKAIVKLDGKLLRLPEQATVIMLNKPAGYVCSRDGQGSSTIYELLPEQYAGLKPIGRLDKDSTGLLLLTDDGALANRLTHPRYEKAKVYEIELDKPLTAKDKTLIESGVKLADGPSQLRLEQIGETAACWRVTMSEGRNRQIRRTFDALGYGINKLHRTRFGSYELPASLARAAWVPVGRPPAA